MISLSSTPTLSEFEVTLRKLGASGPTPLQLPTDPKLRGLWSRAMMIQTIITWAQRNPTSALSVYTDFVAKENLTEKIVRREHGLIAALVAGEVRSNERKTDQTSDFRNAAHSRLRALGAPPAPLAASLLPGFESIDLPPEDESVARRGTVSLTVSADALGSLAFPRQLYSFENGLPKVRNADEFGDWLLEEFRQQRKTDALKFKRPNIEKLRAAGRCLAELFSNTHKFARTGINGATITRSVRGVMTNAVADAGRRYDPTIEPPTISGFLQRLPERHGTGAGVMEISVFDSGPGLAQHWLGRSIDAKVAINEECNAVYRCLQKWGTRGGDESRGLGLHTVMEILSSSDIGGMLFIRTGRLALIRDLHAEPLDSSPQAAKLLETYRMRALYDEKPLASVEGTLISLLLPAPTEGSL